MKYIAFITLLYILVLYYIIHFESLLLYRCFVYNEEEFINCNCYLIDI